jgi:ADP-ribose pyrophosphatase YjhB (NUDIX family)
MDDPLGRHIDAIERAIGDATRGLPEEVFRFVSRVTPLVNVDLLIREDDSRTLLTWRDDEFFGAGWHVPGSIIRYKEAIADRIHACARHELGTDVSFNLAPLLIAESIGTQATRGHAISLLFACRLTGPPEESRKAVTDPPRRGQWRWFDRCPPDLIRAQTPYARFF